MPYAFLLHLHRINDAPLPEATGEYVHAAFFNLLANADSALSAELHARAGRRPFTLALLREGRKAPGDALLRVTILEDSLFSVLVESLLSSISSLDMRLGEARFSLTYATTASDTHPWVGCSRYADLWRAAQPAEMVTIRFTTPTVFRSQGRDVLWPEPRLVWQSWARTWQTYRSNEDPAIDEERLVEQATINVTVLRFLLSTRRIRLTEGAQAGFVGVCAYSLRQLNPVDRQIFTALADFAFYAGTGRKTAMGMGQTRRLPVSTLPQNYEPDGRNPAHP